MFFLLIIKIIDLKNKMLYSLAEIMNCYGIFLFQNVWIIL